MRVIIILIAFVALPALAVSTSKEEARLLYLEKRVGEPARKHLETAPDDPAFRRALAGAWTGKRPAKGRDTDRRCAKGPGPFAPYPPDP